jgi:hypothetical protein
MFSSQLQSGQVPYDAKATPLFDSELGAYQVEADLSFSIPRERSLSLSDRISARTLNQDASNSVYSGLREHFSGSDSHHSGSRTPPEKLNTPSPQFHNSRTDDQHGLPRETQELYQSSRYGPESHVILPTTSGSGPSKGSPSELLSMSEASPTTNPPLTHPASVQTPSNPPQTSPTVRSRKTRREKPRIELASDQPPTTQGKPRARVYVACIQW